MLTEEDRQEIKAEIGKEVVPQIIKAVMEEMDRRNAAEEKDTAEKDAAVNYAELVKNAMK